MLKETQPIFAKRFTGVTLGMQKSYEGGGTEPSILYLRELADIAGVTQDDLQNRELSKEDVNFDKKVKKANKGDSSERFTADQLFAMYMSSVERQDKLMEKQTDILRSIESKMAQETTQAIIDKTVKRIETNLNDLSQHQRELQAQIKGSVRRAAERFANDDPKKTKVETDKISKYAAQELGLGEPKGIAVDPGS